MKLTEKKNITLQYDSTLDEVLGDDSGVTGVRIKNVKTNGTKNIELTGVFIAIGHDPNTKIFKGQIELDEKGYVTKDQRSNLGALFKYYR